MKKRFCWKFFIDLFLVFILVCFILVFSKSVSSAERKSPNNLVVVNMQQGGKCDIEVGDEAKLTKLYEAEVENGGNGLVSSIVDIKDPLKYVHISTNDNLNTLDSKTLEAIKKGCGDNVFNLAKQMTNSPDSFGPKIVDEKENIFGGKIKFDHEKLAGFDNFKFDKLNNPLKIDGFGTIKGSGSINTDDNGINKLILDKGSNFKFDEATFGKLSGKLNNLGEGNWNVKKVETGGVELDGKGLVSIKGAKGWENNPLNFKDFKASLDNSGNYVGDFKAKLDDSMFGDKNLYRTVDLNGRFADLTKNTNLNANFDNKGLLNEMKVNAIDDDVAGFGYDGMKGINVKKGSLVKLKPTADYPGKGGQYRLFADRENTASWRFDKDVTYLLNNNENDLLVSTNGDKVTSTFLDNTQDHNLLVKNNKVIVKKINVPGLNRISVPESGNLRDLASEKIELISSSSEINTESSSRFMQIGENDELSLKGINLDAGGNGKFGDNGFKISRKKEDILFKEVKVFNLEKENEVNGYSIVPGGSLTSLDGKFKKGALFINDPSNKFRSDPTYLRLVEDGAMSDLIAHNTLRS